MSWRYVKLSELLLHLNKDCLMLQSPVGELVIADVKSISWPVPAADEFLVVTAGGVLEIGMNMTLYGHDGRWIGIDAGIGFVDDEIAEGMQAHPTDSVVSVLAPAQFAPIQERLSAFFITHAHEDHIGAISYYWANGFRCPIYCTPFARGLIACKLEEAGILGEVELRVFQPGDTIEIDGFRVESVRVTHSVPEPVAFAITTTVGTLVHTGDWKIDNGPALGGTMDHERLAEIGREGVLAVVSDSTNSCRPGYSASESAVSMALSTVVDEAPGAVIVACFASNVGRVALIAKAALAAGRQVALAGRSMRNANLVANEVGLLSNLNDFLAEPSHLEGLDEREKLLVCTGTQGEQNAILARLAFGSAGRRFPQIGPDTTVILSSTVVPGNEGKVAEVVAALKDKGCRVLLGTDRVDGNPLHVTGHGHAEELRMLYNLLRPAFALPVHGNPDHMVENGRIALSTGVRRVMLVGAGSVTRFNRTNMTGMGQVSLEKTVVVR